MSSINPSPSLNHFNHWFSRHEYYQPRAIFLRWAFNYVSDIFRDIFLIAFHNPARFDDACPPFALEWHSIWWFKDTKISLKLDWVAENRSFPLKSSGTFETMLVLKNFFFFALERANLIFYVFRRTSRSKLNQNEINFNRFLRFFLFTDAITFIWWLWQLKTILQIIKVWIDSSFKRNENKFSQMFAQQFQHF